MPVWEQCAVKGNGKSGEGGKAVRIGQCVPREKDAACRRVVSMKWER